MEKLFFLIFILFSSLSSAIADTIKDTPGQVIRVGVFPNPPVAFKDEQGVWRGIAIDVLQAIADEQGWQLDYVDGSFSDHLKNFEDHKIDLISMMAYSENRAKKYIYSRNTIISNWGVVYSRADSNIGSFLDLDGKRIAVMQGNIHDLAFRNLGEKFGLKFEIVELENFSDVMASVRSEGVDAGVANRLFGALNANAYDLVETGIVFNPINIHYAALAPDMRLILDVIDQHLLAYKADKDSVYFDAIQRWMNQSENGPSYRWVIWLAVGLFSVIMVMAGLTVLLRRQVAARTSELQLEVDERREAERKLDNLAYYDSLTKLPNRVSLSNNLELAIKRASRKNEKIAVLFIDIDRFKMVNDSLGHVAGDKLIVHVSKRLKDCLREEDAIHRFGGDEFVAVLQDMEDISYIDHVAERMLKSLATPITIGSAEIFSSICVGAALYPDDDSKGDNLLKFADAAMYHAKAQGGNNFQFYNRSLTEYVQNRLILETRLRHAIERNEFRLHYQPIINLEDQQPIGVEALLRWQDPDRGLVMPDDFISFAEETGLIIAIGDWVLEHACKQVRQWEDQGLGKLLLSINISSVQFDHDRLYSSVISNLEKSGLAPQQLELEITERMFLKISGNVMKVLDRLTQEGVRLSIDDFGTGYSSLSYLKQLPIDTLKIDRSFVLGMPEEKDDVQIVSAIISMAHGLGMDVIAEGIETGDQLRHLTELGCAKGQGYYLSKPLSPDATAEWLQERM